LIQIADVDARDRDLGVAQPLGWSPFNDEELASGRLVAPFALRVPSDQAWYLVRPRSLRHDRVAPIRAWLLDEARR